MIQSFSSQAKDELARMEPGRPCCMRTELRGLLYMAGSLSFPEQEGPVLRVESKHGATVRRALVLLSHGFDLSPHLRSQAGGGQSGMHEVHVNGDDCRRVITALGLLSEQGLPHMGGEERIPELMRPCCRAAFLRGAFLGGGSVVDPAKEYHLEIVAGDEALCCTLIELLAQYGLQGRKAERKGSLIVYLKEAEQIAETLTLMGCHAARCSLEDARILKGLRNQVNRATNCDSANIAKALDAASRQLTAIDIVEARLGLEHMPEPLQEIARRRRQYPEMTLLELGKVLSPPVGKSGVNHRLKRIELLAESLCQDDEA